MAIFMGHSYLKPHNLLSLDTYTSAFPYKQTIIFSEKISKILEFDYLCNSLRVTDISYHQNQ
jgi:hypothetical protein